MRAINEIETVCSGDNTPVCEPVAGTGKVPRLRNGVLPAHCENRHDRKSTSCQIAGKALFLGYLPEYMPSRRCPVQSSCRLLHNCQRSVLKNLSKAKRNSTIPLQPHRSARELLAVFAGSCLSTSVQRTPSMTMTWQESL